MNSNELLDKLHADLKRLNIPYEAHAQIQNLIQTYKKQVAELDAKKEKKKD